MTWTLRAFAYLFLFTTLLSCVHNEKARSIERGLASFRCEEVFQGHKSALATDLSESRLTKNDAQNLISEKRFQEAAWLLQQIGERSLYKSLEQKIFAELSQGSIVKVEEFKADTNISEIYLVTFESGLKGLFKPDPKYWTKKNQINAPNANIHAEVMAYQFARELEVVQVPVTVLRTINNVQGSLQAFVDFKLPPIGGGWEPKYDTQVNYKKQVQREIFAWTDAQRKDMEMFDFIIQNFDRHVGNSQEWNFEGRYSPRLRFGAGFGRVLFDHGGAFQNRSYPTGHVRPELPQVIFDPKLHENFYQALQTRLTENKIRELMKDTFSEELTQQVLQQRQRTLNYLAEQMAKRK